MFVTDEDVLNAFAITLKKDSGTLVSEADWVPQMVSQQHALAYAELVGSLTLRGFTAAQIALWDYGGVNERQHALYLCLMNGGALHNYDDKFIKTFDRCDVFASAPLLIAGVLTAPAAF